MNSYRLTILFGLLTFGIGKPGKLSEKLYNKLCGIQYGTEPDEFGWITIVEGI